MLIQSGLIQVLVDNASRVIDSRCYRLSLRSSLVGERWGTYVPSLNLQKLSFGILQRQRGQLFLPPLLQTVSSHLCVVCHHFSCDAVSSQVACQNIKVAEHSFGSL